MGVLTEIKTVKINDGCTANPVYLCWLNSLGKFDYWLFSRGYDEQIKTAIETPYSMNIEDLETALGSNGITSKSVANTIDVFGSVALEDLNGIASLFKSPKVQMLANPTTWQIDGVKWKDVIVSSGSMVMFKTKKSFYDIKFTINLPEINVQAE